MERESLMCPSFRCTDTAKLLGVRQHGKIAILPNPLELDQEFISQLKDGSPPENRFRFVSTCRLRGCKQWSGQACGVAKHVMQFVKSVEGEPTPACSIRPQCRWHQQEGPSICRVCPYIITDVDASEIRDYFRNEAQQR